MGWDQQEAYFNLLIKRPAVGLIAGSRERKKTIDNPIMPAKRYVTGGHEVSYIILLPSYVNNVILLR